MSTPNPLPHQPIPFRVLIDQAMGLTRKHFTTLYPIPAVALAGGGALLVIGQASAYSGIKDMEVLMASPRSLFSALGNVFLFALLYWFVVGLASATTSALAVDTVAGREPLPWERLFFALNPRFWGTLLLVGLATIAAFCLCFFPAIYVMLLYCLVIPVMIEEGRFGLAALNRSQALIKYNPHREFFTAPMVKAFVIVVVIALLSYCAALLVQVPFLIVKQVLMFRAIAQHGVENPMAMISEYLWLDIPAAVLGGLASAVITIYGSFTYALFFFDLRRRKEGDDLYAALANIEASHTPGSSIPPDPPQWGNPPSFPPPPGTQTPSSPPGPQ